MNLELLAKSFGKTYPEDNDGTLDCSSVALTCAFNRFGTLLAVGCNDGRVAIWDLMTRCISKAFSGHVHPITSLSWTRDGHHLASGAMDWNVSIWHVLSGECIHTYNFLSPAMHLLCHPKGEPWLLVCPMKHAPVLINTETHDQYVLPTDAEPEQNQVACFDRIGQHVYTGSSRGKILIISTATREIVKKFRVTTSSNTATSIKSIYHARRGSLFLINSSDRVVRIYDTEMILSDACDVEEPDALQKMQDLVNRTSWKKCCFSGDGEYVAAGCSRQNVINIWESKSGNLVKILQGLQGEVLVDVVWHPIRPVIVSVSGGVATVWSHTQAENWSAFAPDFRELEENEEYEEHESEFDDEDEDKSDAGDDVSKLDEESDVDVTTVEKIPAYCSSDEEDGVVRKPPSKVPDLFYIPVTPEIDEPEESGWGQLELPVINIKRKRPAEQEVVAATANDDEPSEKRPKPSGSQPVLPDETSIIDDTNVTTVESDNGSAPLSQQPQPQQSQGRQGEEPVLQLNGEHLPQTAESGEGQESADSINNNNLPSGVLPPLPSQHTDETKVPSPEASTVDAAQ